MSIKTQIIETPSNLYDVIYNEAQDHPSIQCRVKAYDLDHVVDYVKKRYSAYEYNEELGDEETLYLTINICTECQKDNPDIFLNKTIEEIEDACMDCEHSANMEIRKLEEDAKESLNLIVDDMGRFTPYGYNAYVDLTQNKETQ